MNREWKSPHVPGERTCVVYLLGSERHAAPGTILKFFRLHRRPPNTKHSTPTHVRPLARHRATERSPDCRAAAGMLVLNVRGVSGELV